MKVQGKEQKTGRCLPETCEQPCRARQTIREATLSLPRKTVRGRGHVGVQFSVCVCVHRISHCSCKQITVAITSNSEYTRQWHGTNIHAMSIYVKGYVLNKCSLSGLSTGGENSFLQD